ncbi:hypothetical protein [Photobacterium carnosum]|uniref:hypothetical protein n=1 Tax=Photobacterium carnosum TaxID=2023717 RepID=UPI001E3FED8E|nr:hypothetical protein [Photobacterium carnosum]MCD9527556.1 hypothetical protein [Photobacterium carnosum]MCF2163868.1 hypothetical protein [Photobacterium carnosum]
MTNLETLRLSLEKYLNQNGWVVDSQNSSTILSLWVNKQLDESINLPTIDGLHHRRAETTINEAIEDLSDIIGSPISVFRQTIQSMLSPVADHIHIRAAGSAIEHGRINFRTNHRIESAIYSIIKSAAKNFIKKRTKKGKNSTKIDFVETYLSSVNTVVPSGGSFIYNLDIDLTKTDSFDESESIQRYVNSKLAKAINELYVIDADKVTTAALISKGLNEDICSNFIKLFDNDIETIECGFEWSETEPAPELKANKLVFTRNHKENIKKLKEKFNSSESAHLKDANAHLSRIDIKAEYALIRLKIHYQGTERICDAEIDKDTAQELMKTLGENIEQPVMINATLWIEKTASKHHYSLSDITSIHSDKGKNLPLFDQI